MNEEMLALPAYLSTHHPRGILLRQQQQRDQFSKTNTFLQNDIAYRLSIPNIGNLWVMWSNNTNSTLISKPCSAMLADPIRCMVVIIIIMTPNNSKVVHVPGWLFSELSVPACFRLWGEPPQFLLVRGATSHPLNHLWSTNKPKQWWSNRPTTTWISVHLTSRSKAAAPLSSSVGVTPRCLTVHYQVVCIRDNTATTPALSHPPCSPTWIREMSSIPQRTL